VKALVGELKHDTSFKRRAAAEALEDVDDPRATQPLLAALNDDEPTVRVSAIHALSKDPSAEVVPKLVERLCDPEACVRLAAAEVLAKRIDPALAPEFLKLLADRSLGVAYCGVKVLQGDVLSDPLDFPEFNWEWMAQPADPPLTCITASVFPWVGRTLPIESGIQSICAFITALIAPCRSGLHQTWPSDQADASRNSCTFG